MTTYYTTAVYWPKDGAYGGHSRRYSHVEDARKDAESLKRMDCGHAHNPIHIIKHVESEVVEVFDNSTPATSGPGRGSEVGK